MIITYFDSLWVEYNPKEIERCVSNKNIITNIFRAQSYDSIMCGCFCIGSTTFIFKVRSLTDFTNLLSPDNFKKNDEIILNWFLKENV